MSKLYSIILNPVFLFIITFVMTAAFCYIAIGILKANQFGQVIREDGPENHLKKSGTPTMGGVVFIFVLLIIEFLFLVFKDYINGTKALKIVIFIIIFGFIGLIDDYLKVTKKNTKGLPGLFKLILQILFAGFGLIICFNFNTTSNLFAFVFLIFIIVGTDNGVNFTDGLDGLCTLVTIVVSLFYIALSIRMGSNELLFLNIVMLAILLAFLVFNHYPGKVFMGDTGSLLLGAYVAFMAIALEVQYFLPIFGVIYMVEVLSVILQVTYFKATGGKRIFKMAPIHHHFEKCNMTENQIVLMFTIITVIMCVVTYVIVI